MTPRPPRICRAIRTPLRRGGVAVAELAVCLPVIVVIALGVIETCSMIFLKQSLSIAAYEGAHVAIAPGSTSADVRRTCEAILRDRRVKNANISFHPAPLERLREGDLLKVVVAAPTESNAILPVRFFRGRTLQGAASFMLETNP